MERFAADIPGVVLAHPDRKDAPKRQFGNLAGIGQWIKGIDDTLRAAQPGRPRRARRAGVIARIVAYGAAPEDDDEN
jgi:hypothetical protein